MRKLVAIRYSWQHFCIRLRNFWTTLVFDKYCKNICTCLFPHIKNLKNILIYTVYTQFLPVRFGCPPNMAYFAPPLLGSDQMWASHKKAIPAKPKHPANVNKSIYMLYSRGEWFELILSCSKGIGTSDKQFSTFFYF